ncbi:hypothetical protein CVD28_05390 [Bacillus sp. M6-12]|uniref:hypothetical protein n=1 Tax=Bacillus sp. M6-12 TaxID=2054166 RepID=UPI000C78AAAA|nr:hypothetical protein [Bacillus sp. M6-12]PLS18573.1 hypothetical protein CVD28_05390 [Bacillus sp. M6-12]
MFNFEEWTEEVHRIIDEVEAAKEGGVDLSNTDKELNDLWQEMTQHQDDASVQFLMNVLSHTKDLLNGHLKETEFEEIIKGMRDEALK